jgi:hypothetical protein
MKTRRGIEDFFTGVITPKKNSEFEDEFDVKVPTEGEVRIIANRNR